MRNSRWFAPVLIIVFLACGSIARSEDQAAPNPSSIQLPTDNADPQQHPGLPPLDRQGPDEKQQKDMEKERRKQRWQDIKRDSEKLLETATELKQYVDKAGENVMSLEVIKKAEQMEKLSKELQKKMKGD